MRTSLTLTSYRVLGIDREWFCWEGELLAGPEVLSRELVIARQGFVWAQTGQKVTPKDRPGIYNIDPNWIERNPPVDRLLPLIAPDGLIEIKRVKCFDQPIEIDVIA